MAVRHKYSDGFQAAWEAYPHHPRRRNKVEAYAQWKRLGLESAHESVVAWAEAEEGGQYQVAMERWLKRKDFSEPYEQAAPSVAERSVDTPVTMFNVWDRLIEAAGHLTPDERATIKPAIEGLVPEVVSGRMTAEQAIEAASSSLLAAE